MGVFIFDSFRRILKVSNTAAAVGSNISSNSSSEMMVENEQSIQVKERENSEEGFARQGRGLTLTRGKDYFTQ